MAMTYKQDGDVIGVVAAAAIASGDMVKQGAFIGVALGDAAIGETAQVKLNGVFSVPCLSTDVVAQGDLLYFDVADGWVKLDDETGANSLAGKAFASKAAAITTVEIKLES
jgi:predicted RecA/RadA family phage recombinase